MGRHMNSIVIVEGRPAGLRIPDRPPAGLWILDRRDCSMTPPPSTQYIRQTFYQSLVTLQEGSIESHRDF